MTPPELVPVVVYHVAALGHWRSVAAEQLRLLRESGLGIDEPVRVTFVGAGREWLEAEAARAGCRVEVVRSDPNTDHYETFAMLEVERLAKREGVARPILYLHTKGVSAPPDYPGKTPWRRVMEEHTVRRWRHNVWVLADGAGYDAVGFNWYSHGEQHFSGNFWIARADWIRKLPDFAAYHGRKGLVRYSCETWIGAHQFCRAYSLGCRDRPTWDTGFDFAAHFPRPRPPAATERNGMTPAIIDFLARARRELSIPAGRVLEVGSLDVNGSPRVVFGADAESYLGVDAEPGAGVDLALDAEGLIGHFAPGSFDTVICCETLEHCVRPWVVVDAMKAVLKAGGHLWVSTPTFGFPEHRYPIDCYRFGEDAYRRWLFADTELLRLELLTDVPGHPVIAAVGRKG